MRYKIKLLIHAKTREKAYSYKYFINQSKKKKKKKLKMIYNEYNIFSIKSHQINIK